VSVLVSLLARVSMMATIHLRPWLFVLAFTAAFSPVCVYGQISGNGTAPLYTAQSIVNAATQTGGALAPNTIATLYGTNLSFDVRAVASSDIVRGMMPTSLDGVGVWVNSLPCSLFSVSPTQINFLVPYQLTAGTVSLVVARDSQAGPTVSIQLNSTSPGLFLWNGNNAVAGHLSGVALSDASPAVPGEVVVIYAAGLGRTSPDTTGGQLATSAFQIYYLSQFQVLLNGVACPTVNVLYAGLAPGFAGLYQINLRLPDDVAANPQIQVSVGPQISASSIQLAVEPPQTAAQ
jgi:uncharacterized protein (TIGR03437 family)